MSPKPEAIHVLSAIPDYVLGLLPADEAEWVAAHLSSCSQCRNALSAEQKIGHAVRETLSAAARPDPIIIRCLMPTSLPANRPLVRWPAFAPGMAAVAIMLVVLFGAAAIFSSQRPGAWTLSAPTARSTAMVLTDTPTSTATREMTATAEGQETSQRPGLAQPSPSVNQVRVPAPALVPVPGASYLKN